MAGPFPRSLPPNHAGAFQRTWLSSDFCRVQGRLPMDDVVACTADREGLTPHLRHERRPGGLARAGSPETSELADLVHQHLARLPAQLAPPLQEPVDQLLAGRGTGPGTWSVRTAPFFRTCGIPPNRATRSGLPSRWILASKQVRSRAMIGSDTSKPADLGFHHDQRACALRRDGGI